MRLHLRALFLKTTLIFVSFGMTGCLEIKHKTLVATPGEIVTLTKDTETEALVPDENKTLVESTITLPAGSLVQIGQRKAPEAKPVGPKVVDQSKLPVTVHVTDEKVDWKPLP